MSHRSPQIATATVEKRLAAIEAAFAERGITAGTAVAELEYLAQEEWLPRNGAHYSG